MPFGWRHVYIALSSKEEVKTQDWLVKLKVHTRIVARANLSENIWHLTLREAVEGILRCRMWNYQCTLLISNNFFLIYHKIKYAIPHAKPSNEITPHRASKNKREIPCSPVHPIRPILAHSKMYNPSENPFIMQRSQTGIFPIFNHVTNCRPISFCSGSLYKSPKILSSYDLYDWSLTN